MKTTEYGQDVMSWLASDLGQTMPEFTTEGSAGYGERRRKFVGVKSVTQVSPTGFLNPQSDRYERVATFLQSDLGQATTGGTASAGEQGRRELGKRIEEMKQGWGSAYTNTQSKSDALIADFKNTFKSYVNSPMQFVKDLIYTVNPTKDAGTGPFPMYLARKMREEQDALYRMDALIKVADKVPRSALDPEYDKWRTQYFKDAATYMQMNYVVSSLTLFKVAMMAAGVHIVDPAQPWVMAAIRESTIAKTIYTLNKDTRGGSLSVIQIPIVIALVVLILGGLIIYFSIGTPAKEYAHAKLKVDVEKWRADEDARIAAEQRKAGLPEPEIARLQALRNGQRLQNDQLQLEAVKARSESDPVNKLLGLVPWVIGGLALFAFMPMILELTRAKALSRQLTDGTTS